MENIWSKNKYVNLAVNILLFFMSMNFMHYGQIIIPLICLIIFIDRRFRFQINSLKVFCLLVLFGIVFYIFSRKDDFFCFMGMMIPMAYYIGSNIFDSDQSKIKYVLYILAFGMAFHVLLNFGYDLAVRGIECFTRNSHLDFWYKDEFPTTQTAVNYVFILSLIYYLFVYEKNRSLAYLMLSVSVLLMIYAIALGRRTTFLMVGLSVLSSIVYDALISGNKSQRSLILRKIVLAVFFVLLILIAMYFFNIFGLREKVRHISIINKLYWFGLNSNRIEVLIETLKLAPDHMFGGSEISTILDIEPHDLWMDTFNYAGIIAFILLVIYSLYCFQIIKKAVTNHNLSDSYRLMITVFYLCVIVQMFLEPVMTGSSIFLLSTVIMVTLTEKLTF